MKLKFTATSLFSVLFLAAIPDPGLAQCTQTTAVSDITLQCSGAGNTRTGVAYHPTHNKYYSVVAGTTSYSIETFALTGGSALSSTVQGGDYRGFWYNMQLGTIEGNTFNSVGIFRHNVDPATGFAAGSFTNLTLGAMPNAQSCGDYDPVNDQVLYYDAGSIYKYSRTTGLQLSSIPITGLPAGNISIYSLGYTGVSGAEVCLYDYSNQAVRFINYTTGAYVSSCQLPAGTPAPPSYRMSYANNRIFLYDQPLQRWYGYKVTSLPDVVFTGSNTICAGSQFSLAVSGSSTYVWSTSATQSSITGFPATNTVYAVVATSASGCTTTSNFYLTVKPSPTVSAVTNASLICGVGDATLTASGANNYTWAVGPTTSTAQVTPSVYGTTTTYTVLGETGGCVSMATVAVGLDLDPVVSVAASPSAICLGNTVTLTASGANTYTWNGGATTSSITMSPTANTGYTVTGTSALGCTGTLNVASTSVIVNPLPVLSTTASASTICLGGTVTLTASGSGLGPTSYSWTSNLTGTNSISTSPVASTVYTVTGTNANGCIGSNSIAIMVDACTALNALTKDLQTLSIYPNPNNGSFTIHYAGKNSLNIVNSLGQVILVLHPEQNANGNYQINSLARGIYFIVAEGNGEMLNQKIIVGH